MTLLRSRQVSEDVTQREGRAWEEIERELWEDKDRCKCLVVKCPT
jgi:hypothetical protein